MTGTAPVRVRARVSAYALVVREGRMLLTRLSDASPVFAPGLWHLPGGGVDPGEQPVEALVRELREETGLEAAGVRLLDARSYGVRRDGVTWHLTALFYAVEPAEGAEAAEGPEGPECAEEAEAGVPVVAETGGSTDAVAWVPLPDLPDVPLSPPAADALRLLPSPTPGDGRAGGARAAPRPPPSCGGGSTPRGGPPPPPPP
ncbi:NUDIX hydrolase, partial [Streptomyces sp. NPDC059762]|uniref:NUDIX hydrolase n=1 Tax=Streptomyces sp. NPDC059762 TaxID=3346938 RepID=UPI00365904B2